jgi:hypothetical protein
MWGFHQAFAFAHAACALRLGERAGVDDVEAGEGVRRVHALADPHFTRWLAGKAGWMPPLFMRLYSSWQRRKKKPGANVKTRYTFTTLFAAKQPLRVQRWYFIGRYLNPRS